VHLILLDHSNYIWWRVQVMKPLIMQFSPTSWKFRTRWHKILYLINYNLRWNTLHVGIHDDKIIVYLSLRVVWKNLTFGLHINM
jgi:hypothetical protein